MTLENIKVLVVDDDEVSRIGCERILELSKYEVDLAEDGMEGLEKIRNNNYDLVVTDLMMPRMDGMQFLEEIRKIDEKIVPIVITGYATIENAVDAVKKGAYDYLAKPFTPDEFRAKIERALEKRRLLLEAEKLRAEHIIEKTRTNTIINCMSEGVIATNKEGQILLINPAALKMLRLKDGDVFGKNVLGLLSNPDLEKKIANALSKVTSCEILEKFEVNLGNGRVLQPNITPVIDENGALIGTVTVLIDVSEEKKIDQMKTDFLSLVAHELKAPLGAIEGYLNLILEGVITGNPEKEKDYITKSRDRANELLAMVNDLLDLTRAEKKVTAKVMSALDISSVLRGTCEFYKNEAKAKDINFACDIPDQLPAIRGNEEDMGRVFDNLVSNAIKYTPEHKSVHVQVTVEKNKINVIVKDTGIGMSEEDKHKIFDEFYRAKNAVSQRISGTGLGLSIAKRIIEDHNGYIEIDSDLVNGSTFTVVLPVIEENIK